MTYQCPQCGLPRTGNQAMGLAMPQCVCSWQFTPPQTPPPEREWVGLTDEDIREVLLDFPRDFQEWYDRDFVRYTKAIEAKLRSKNT